MYHPGVVGQTKEWMRTDMTQDNCGSAECRSKDKCALCLLHSTWSLDFVCPRCCPRVQLEEFNEEVLARMNIVRRGHASEGDMPLYAHPLLSHIDFRSSC